MPTFGVDFDIEIGGVLFRSATSPNLPKDIIAEETVAPKITTAANRGIQDFNELTARVYSAWQEGMGQDIYRTDAPFSPNRFNTSSGINISDAGKISLIADNTLKQAITGVTTSDNPFWSHISVARIHRDTIWICYKKSSDSKWYIGKYDTSAGTYSEALAPENGGYNATDICFIGSVPYITTDAGVYKGAINFNISSYTIVNNTTGGYRMVAWEGDLYLVSSSPEFTKVTTSGTATSLKTNMTGYYFIDITLHQNQPIVLASTYSDDECLLYAYDGSTTSLFARLPKGFVGRSITGYMGVLYVCGSIGGHPCVLAFVAAIGPTQLFYDDDISGFVRRCDGYLDNVYFAIQGYGGISKETTVSGQSAGYVSAVLVKNGVKHVVIVDSGIYGESTNKVASGYLTSGMDYYDMPTQDKVYTTAKLLTEPLPVGSSVRVYYRLDSDLSFTELSAVDRHDDTNATSKTYNLVGGSGDYLIGKGIEFKVELYRATDTTVSPIVTSLGYFFAPKLPLKHTFKVALASHDYADTLIKGQKDTRTGGQIIAALEAVLVYPTFTYRDSNYSNTASTVRLTKKLYREIVSDKGKQKFIYLELKEI
ncbi:MAG TPA: hypothetical protein VGK02_06305 [Candidatus Aquicultor sp.]|jgi:hypothetical protein